MQKRKIFTSLVVVFLAGLGFFTRSGELVSASSAAQTEETQSVMDVIQTNDQLESFEALVKAAALDDNLEGNGPFTVFAPTDAAMADLESLAANTEASATDILLYHVINGRYTGSNVANQGLLPTLMGESIVITTGGGDIFLNDEVKVTTTDIEATNGVVHIIDTILLPPVNSLITTNKGSRGNTLDEVLAADGRFTTFLSLLEMAGLKDDLADLSQTYTVFAPTDAAFEQLPGEQLDEWLADPESLETILSYHLVGDTLGINQIVTDDFIPTLEGRPLIVSTDDNLRVSINNRPLESFNIIAANGVIHAVDTVLLP